MKRNWKAERIVQIIPATGWYARYKQDNGQHELSQLQCFALVERSYAPNDELEQTVHGMDADDSGHMEFADEASNFAGLIHESDPEFRRPFKIDA